MSVESKELRQFGLTAGALLAVVFGLLLPGFRGHHVPLWPWLVGGAMVLGGVIHPPSLRYLFAIWSAVGRRLAWINSRIVLTTVFYLVITPMGLFLRLAGRDPMARRSDPAAQTYRVPSPRSPIRNLDRPF